MPLARWWMFAGVIWVVLSSARAPAQVTIFESNRGQCCPPGQFMPLPAEATPTPERKGEQAIVPETTAADPYSNADMGGETVSLMDSCVGYIDPAIPGNMFRFRYDAAYRSNRPTRAEYFYARGAPLGPGLPLPERSVDYQEVTAYLEGLLTERFSILVETPVRFLDPEVNRDHAGFGDMTAGFKWAFQYSEGSVSTFQTRVCIPTGNAGQGLGNDHASIEPGLLFYRQLSPVWTAESEVRYWFPIDGTSFAGDLVRYGIGLSYGERPADQTWITPVAEVVGWTVLAGREAIVPPIVPFQSKSATGDTIVNVKLGLRLGFGDRLNFYAGYGRAVTGDVWYKDIVRTEMRLSF